MQTKTNNEISNYILLMQTGSLSMQFEQKITVSGVWLCVTVGITSKLTQPGRTGRAKQTQQLTYVTATKQFLFLSS